MTVYIPLSLADRLLPRLTLAGRDTSTRFAVSRSSLDLSALSCAVVRFACTSLWLRTPFIHPFSCGTLRNEYADPYHTAHGVDWIWLSGDAEAFEKHLRELCATNPPDGVSVAAFDSMSGTIRQDDSSGEPEIRIRRGVKNYNQEQWVKACEAMLDAPESEWPKYAPNTRDSYPLLAPHLEKYVRREPRLILDLGCGVGQTARSLALRHPKAQVVGIDASAEAIAVAKRHFQRDNLHFMAMGIGGELPFDSGSADLIVAVNALMYGEDQRKASREVFRVLNPQGALVHNSRMMESHLFWDFPWSLLGPTLFQLNAADWIEAGRERGFSTVIKNDSEAMVAFAGFFTPGSSASLFHPGASEEFKAMFEAGMKAEKAAGRSVYRPWHSHSIMVHAEFLRDQTAGCDTPSCLARLDNALSRATEMNQTLLDAAIVGWNLNAATLQLCPEAFELLRLMLPKSGPMLSQALMPPCP
jgi:SAM-dependent methyltransferase